MKNELELRIGDYISEPNDEEIYSKEDFVLSQIVRKGNRYTRLFVEKLIIEDKLYDTVDELKENLHKDAYLYYVEDDFEFSVGSYLVYNSDICSDYEILVKQENSKFRIFMLEFNDYYDEEGFDTLEEVESYLRKGFSLIKKLRVSTCNC